MLSNRLQPYLYELKGISFILDSLKKKIQKIEAAFGSDSGNI